MINERKVNDTENSMKIEYTPNYLVRVAKPRFTLSERSS